jgi:hypothetical protein
MPEVIDYRDTWSSNVRIVQFAASDVKLNRPRHCVDCHNYRRFHRVDSSCYK